MNLKIKHLKQLSGERDTAIIVNSQTDLSKFLPEGAAREYLHQRIKREMPLTTVNLYDRTLYFLLDSPQIDLAQRKEYFRKKGYELSKILKNEPVRNIELTTELGKPEDVLALAEGLALSNYEFLKYKSDKSSKVLHNIWLHGTGLVKGVVEELENLIEAVFIARDLVNEPVIYLTAEQFSKEMEELGKEAGFDVEVLNKAKIKSLKMGGLLGVNAGSPNSPTFNILEYKHDKPVNSKPYILVGKGVVYDTGGLSLKPTTNSMDCMKSDMAGAAAVLGALCAVAKNKLPLHVIALIPATENRPDGNAITPGDVITMHDGTTVEVLNTDAEGRLILADALSYAKRYEPELVLDMATLTGAASRAIGKEGIVYMGTAGADVKTQISEAGFDVYERLVEFPMWDEYDEIIQSSVADLKNIGGDHAGAITAGMFLKHFTEYPWLHFDIAGSAFLETGEWNYRGRNGSGVGVRLLYKFLKMQAG